MSELYMVNAYDFEKLPQILRIISAVWLVSGNLDAATPLEIRKNSNKLFAEADLINSASFSVFLDTVVGCGSNSSMDIFP
nr:2667_t:CDS:2 [Entrophospora candida]